MKITTDDCKAALGAQYSKTKPSDWKRLHKAKMIVGSGAIEAFEVDLPKGTESIVRTFHAKSIGELALVFEHDGVIAGIDSQTVSEADIDDLPWLQLKAPNAADYVFHAEASKEEGYDEDMLSVAMCPAAFFRRHGYMYDQHLSGKLGNLLPEDFDEVTEAIFMVPGSDPKALAAKLTAIGFLEDPKFGEFMSKF